MLVIPQSFFAYLNILQHIQLLETRVNDIPLQVIYIYSSQNFTIFVIRDRKIKANCIDALHHNVRHKNCIIYLDILITCIGRCHSKSIYLYILLFIHKKMKWNLVWFWTTVIRSFVFDSKSILLLKSHVSFKRHLCSNLHSEVHLQWMQVYFVWTAVCPLDSLQRNLTCIILWEVMTDKWFQQLFHVSGEDGKKSKMYVKYVWMTLEIDI